MAPDIHDQLTKYVSDAHAIEVQAIAQLEQAPGGAKEPRLAQALREHLRETEVHEQLTRDLLDERGAAPNRLKDMVMNIGGKGFLAFAAVQPDSPGKLLAHALSFEALEAAAYEELACTADRAGEQEVASTARRIRDDERAMMRRLAGLFDPVVETALAEVGRDDLTGQLRTYLADAHAVERQSAVLLEKAPALSGEHARLEQAYDDHLVETREHAELVKGRLDALGGDTSSIKDAAMRLGALNWSTFFSGHPDTPGKLLAFAYAFEHLEIGGYEQLRRVAARAGDDETATAAESILAQERAAAERLGGLFDEGVAASLEALGVSSG